MRAYSARSRFSISRSSVAIFQFVLKTSGCVALRRSKRISPILSRSRFSSSFCLRLRAFTRAYARSISSSKFLPIASSFLFCRTGCGTFFLSPLGFLLFAHDLLRTLVAIHDLLSYDGAAQDTGRLVWYQLVEPGVSTADIIVGDVLAEFTDRVVPWHWVLIRVCQG